MGKSRSSRSARPPKEAPQPSLPSPALPAPSGDDITLEDLSDDCLRIILSMVLDKKPGEVRVTGTVHKTPFPPTGHLHLPGPPPHSPSVFLTAATPYLPLTLLSFHSLHFLLQQPYKVNKEAYPRKGEKEPLSVRLVTEPWLLGICNWIGRKRPILRGYSSSAA
jgi:hypothetical protein